ncbi:hypothetical protein GCM10023094_00560 [Rhodococcus olei]|uniref:Cytochrome c domain-containing protein n=1 Tax=Rhodococcus olei TaxID=2161675 RepID=A0ABP8NTW0_9NOCA
MTTRDDHPAAAAREQATLEGTADRFCGGCHASVVTSTGSYTPEKKITGPANSPTKLDKLIQWAALRPLGYRLRCRDGTIDHQQNKASTSTTIDSGFTSTSSTASKSTGAESIS